MRVIIRFKSGFEMPITCDSFSMTQNLMTSEITEYEIKGVTEIDAVPVVRCKDCKWSVEHYDVDGNVPYWVCRNWDYGTDADGFCYKGERREDDNDQEQ